MAMQRPGGRQTSRIGPPAAPAKPATAARPAAGRPATQPVAKQPAPAPAPAPARGRAAGSSTRSVAKQGQSRPVPKQAGGKNNTMLFVGIGAGVLVLLVVGFVMMGGESHKPATPAPEKASKPKVVDVAGLEKDGFAKCDQGLAIIKKCGSQMGSSTLSDAEKSRLKADLEQGTALIRDGMAALDEANRKSGNTYPVSQYIEAKKAARMKLGELGAK